MFQFKEWNLGLYRDAFDEVASLSGFKLAPIEGVREIWNFKSLNSGKRGRMMDISGYLSDEPISLNAKGTAYMITRQDYTLALLLPPALGRLNMNEARYKVMDNPRKTPFPATWSKEMVAKVIRHKWKNIIILDEAYLLGRIGLRKGQAS